MMANHAAQADPNMAMMRNDENAVVNHHKSLTTGNKTPAVTKPAAAGAKTPAATKTRRAFGDISNRKNAATAQGNKGSITLGKTPANTTLKLAPTTKKTPFQNTTSKRRVNFNLPPESQQAQKPVVQAGAATATAAPKPVNLDNSDVDDIEQPAGRLWFQQQALLDAADADADDISLEGAATMVEDLEAMLNQRHELKVQMEVEEFERHLTEVDDPPFANVFLPDGK
jgi:hypothetical protein